MLSVLGPIQTRGGGGAVRFRPDSKAGGGAVRFRPDPNAGGGGAVRFRPDSKAGGGCSLLFDDLYLGLCARA